MSDATAGRRYHVREILGRGGFGTVYRAELVTEGGFGKIVALKVLNNNLKDQPGQLSRLRDEARMLGLVSHRALISADALIHLDGHWTVVMEYIAGATVAEVLRADHSLPASVALTVAIEVASALVAVWEAETEPGRPLRLLHRDVKPSNLQLTDMGDVKILDFGVARAEFDGREAATQQVVFGSPPYLSPERLELLDTPAGDVFALGASLAEMLTGHRPEAVAARPGPHAERIGKLVRATEEVTQDPAMAKLVADMMAYDMEERPSMTDVESRCRALRKRHDAPDIRTWAKSAIPRVQARREVNTGELSGRAFDEASEAIETDLTSLPGAAMRTWDPAPPTMPPISEPAEPPPTPAVDAPPAPQLQQLPPPKKELAVMPEGPPIAKGMVTWFRGLAAAIVVSVGAMGAGVIGVVVVTVLVTGVGCWSSLSPLAEAVCVSTIEEADRHLDNVGTSKQTAQARAVTARADAACRNGDLGMFGAIEFSEHVERATKDGDWTRVDQKGLERLAAKSLPP